MRPGASVREKSFAVVLDVGLAAFVDDLHRGFVALLLVDHRLFALQVLVHLEEVAHLAAHAELSSRHAVCQQRLTA